MPDLPNTVYDAITSLQAERNEPLCAYIYDLVALGEHVQSVVRAMPERCEMFYATKANPALPVLRTIEPLVHGFEVASGGELDWVREHFPTTPVLFGGPGKLESELESALRQGVELIHVESLLELRRLCTLAKDLNRRQDILLRINLELDDLPTTRLTMGGVPTPFGMEEAAIDQAITLLAQQEHLTLRGFHFHLVSHQLDEQKHLGLLRAYFETVRRWERHYDLAVSEINVGGGIGVNYAVLSDQFNWRAFCSGLSRLLEEHADRPWTIRFECGRFLTAACGYYVGEVIDIKSCNSQWFVVCRGGTHHFRTPAAQSHDHPFCVVPGPEIATKKEVGEWAVVDAEATLVGQLCTPKDVFARNVHVDRIELGHAVVFKYAGAYAWNISHREFLMHPHPREIFIK